MPLASQVEGPRSEVRVAARPDPMWNWQPSFHRGLGGKCDYSTVLISTCLQPLHTCKHVCMLGSKSVTCRRSAITSGSGFLGAIFKLTATIWPKMLKVTLNTNQALHLCALLLYIYIYFLRSPFQAHTFLFVYAWHSAFNLSATLAKHLRLQLFSNVDKVSCPRTQPAAPTKARTWDPTIQIPRLYQLS